MEKVPKNILIIKLSAIGDVVHAIPLLEVLGQNFPEARIDWLVEEEASEIIKGHKKLNKIIISYRKTWQKKFFKSREQPAVIGDIFRFLRELRSEEYDLVIDLQGLFKSGILTGISRGTRKIGSSGGREGSSLFLTEDPYVVDYNQHALDRYLKVADYLNCDKDSWRGDIPIGDSDKASIDDLIRVNGIRVERLVTINPLARWKTKLWEPLKFGALAERLRKELSCDILFTGSGHDRSIIEEIIGMTEGKSINAAGKTSLKELAYLYSRCRLLISTDTGPMHMAAAMARPVVALFGPTDPWRTGPYGSGHKVIREEMECSPCFKKRCHHMTCMKNIAVEKVFNAVKALLDR